jgi:hypothetical protein
MPNVADLYIQLAVAPLSARLAAAGDGTPYLCGYTKETGNVRDELPG